MPAGIRGYGGHLLIDLPRTGITPDDLRGLPEYAALRAEIGHAFRREGAPA